MAKPSLPPPLARRILARMRRAAGQAVAGRPERVATFDFLTDVDQIRADRMTGGEGRRRPRRGHERQRQIAKLFHGEANRRARTADYREMDREVPELHRSRRVLVSFIFGGTLGEGEEDSEVETTRSFRVKFAPDARPEVERCVEETIALMGLHREVRSVLDEGIHLGDSFSELNYLWRPDRTADLGGLLPIWNERVDVEEVLGFVDSYVISPLTGGGDPRRLAPFQVLHYAHQPSRGCRYGTSLFSSARKQWRTSDAVGDVLGLMALTSPRDRVTHHWPFPDGYDRDELWQFIYDVQAETEHDLVFDRDAQLQKRVVPQLETADIFTPYLVFPDDTGSVDPDGWAPKSTVRRAANLQQLVTVLEFFQDRAFIATGVPASLAGFEKNVNAKATLQGQLEGFSLEVREHQGDAADLVRDLLVRACLAREIRPELGEFRIVMPSPSEFDRELRAQVVKLRSEAAAELLNAGLPASWVLRRTLDVPPEEADEVAAEMTTGTEQAATESLARTMAQIDDRQRDLPAVTRDSDPRAPAFGPAGDGGGWAP